MTLVFTGCRQRRRLITNTWNFVTLSSSYSVPADLIESIPEPEAKYSFGGKQMERTYWLEPQFVYFHSHSAALIHSCHKSHHKGSNGAYDGSFQLPRPFAGIEGTNGQYSPRQSGKLTLMDSRPSFGRSKDAASFTLPSLFSFPLARKEDEEA